MIKWKVKERIYASGRVNTWSQVRALGGVDMASKAYLSA